MKYPSAGADVPTHAPVLTGEFAESGGRDFEEQPQDSIHDYDYPSDSELDTGSEDGDGANEDPARM